MLATPLRSLPLALCLAAGFANAQGGSDPAEAVIQAGAAIRAELLKAAIASKTVKEGLESFRREQDLKNKALELKATLKQADLLCQTTDTQDTLAKAGGVASSKAHSAQQRTLHKESNNFNTAKLLDSRHQNSNSKFCTEQEQALGICKLSTDAKYSNLAGADQDALFLFQTRDGGDTYASGRDGPQTQAAESYISRVVAGFPAEQLRASGPSAYSTNPQARAYVELQRRYQALLSMSSYSLNRIKEFHNPIK